MDDFETLKKKIKTLENAINTNIVCTKNELVKENVKVIKEGLSTRLDEVVAVQTSVTDLKKHPEDLKEKCKD